MLSNGYTAVAQDEGDFYTVSRKELVAQTRPRIWRNLLLGTVGVMLVVAAGIATIILTGGSPDLSSPQALPQTSSRRKGIELMEVLNGTFSVTTFNGTWISDTEYLYRTDTGALNMFHANTLTHTELVSEQVMAAWRPFKYSISPSRKYLLIVHDVQKLFRYSYLARHTVLNLESPQDTLPLAPSRVRVRSDQPPLLYATWAPTTDALAFVSHNDLYYATGPDLSTMYRLTDTGQIGSIFNGIPDWVYEEEIFSSNSALWFSPDGNRLAFGTFNDTQVDTMNFPLYGRPGDLAFQYPIQQSIKFPKPGRSNPVVDLWVVDLIKLTEGSGETVIRLPPPDSLKSIDHYFTAVSWSTSEKVSVIWMNRHQNVNIISICSLNGVCEDDLVHESPDQTWNDLYTAPLFDKAIGDSYLIILPTPNGDKGNFKHINIRRSSDKTLIPLTSGSYEVIEILKWDEENHVIYYTGAPQNKPSQRQLYYVGDLQSSEPKQAYCITCDFTNDYRENCTYNSADFSEGGSFYVLTCGGPGIPQVTLHNAQDHSRLMLIEDNQGIRNELLDRSLPIEKRLEINITDGFKARVSMKLPPDYNSRRFEKYPLLVYTYGGPGSQQVSDRFKIDWGDYLASSRGVIYATIDGRGSGYSGEKMLHALYRNLGVHEVDDQITITKELQNEFPYIDASRTAIWGWSYGGYVVSAALARDYSDVFKCGIAVAPVTSWIYYDTVYTERYMGLPTPNDNLEGYESSDVTRNVSNFRNKQFFLIHGNADDNVHYQQSMMLARALELEDILFRAQSYPDENHGLAGVKRHHYHSMEDFLDTCFNKS